ncbi:MAG: carboxylesterase family protein [Pseudomonadota bacterium]
MITRIAALTALILAAACAKQTAPAVEPVPDETAVRITAQGEVIGFQTQDGAHAWKGLPFAAPPVGDLRWRAPRPAADWQGARVATQSAERCAQMSNRLNEGEGIEPGVLLGSEDCLYLDIYAPPDAKDRALPVMVWIHGGANVWGRGSSYDGSRLALNEDVIVVPVQYRVGPFGFFSHPALRADAIEPEDAAANFALLDLIAALGWVRENIAAFGGDPERVTIFGESAGGHNVAMLLASPLADGLFHRAILQSGSFDSISREAAESADSAEPNPAMKISAMLGADSGGALRAVPAPAVIEAYKTVNAYAVEMPTVIEDGLSLPGYPMREAFSSTDTFNAVPIITGTNKDELKFFHIGSPALTKKFLGVFLTSRDNEFYNAMSDYPSRIWRIRSVDEPAAMMAAAGHDYVYAYRFDWDEGGRFLFTDLAHLLGAAHAIEIPFVFNRFVLLGDLDRIMFGKKTAASREELSRAMGAYWAGFARDGAPGGDGLAPWPAWSSAGGTLMRFDSEADGGVSTMVNTDSMSALIADLETDPRLNAEERCLVVEAIRVWLDGLASEIGASLGCAD